MTVKRILVIAGSDSSGGAGLEADQKVIAAHGCYAMTATTALTAQNTLGVVDIHTTPPAFLRKQIDAVCEDVGVDVVKTGMLASAETIEVVADALKRWKVRVSVVDPVMVSTSGSQLLPRDAVQTLIDRVLPQTYILTPNLPEAKLLLSIANVQFREPTNVDDLVAIAKSLQLLGPKYVLLKGGHLPFTKGRVVATEEAKDDVVINVLVGEGRTEFVENGFVRSRNTHGTGCSLASAIACNLAAEMDVVKAVMKANKYVEAGIKTSSDIGGFVEYLLEREDVQGPWKEYTEHDFVAQMADGTLPVEQFKNYLVQDYLFLIHFARANALAAYKSTSMADIGRSAQQVLHLQQEINLHIDFCKDYGLSVSDLESTEEHQACTAYTRYVLDIGQSSDYLALQIALLPCLLGYGRIARRLHDDARTVREGSRYWKWIETYVAEDYVEAMANGCALIEEHATKQSVSRIEELASIFIHATKMETGFWEMGVSGARTSR